MCIQMYPSEEREDTRKPNTDFSVSFRLCSSCVWYTLYVAVVNPSQVLSPMNPSSEALKMRGEGKG